jgi:hypothetical protein
VQFIFGIAFFILSIFIVICLAMSSTDKLMQILDHHLGWKTGYTEAAPKLMNPTDLAMSAFQKVRRRPSVAPLWGMVLIFRRAGLSAGLCPPLPHHLLFPLHDHVGRAPPGRSLLWLQGNPTAAPAILCVCRDRAGASPACLQMFDIRPKRTVPQALLFMYVWALQRREQGEDQDEEDGGQGTEGVRLAIRMDGLLGCSLDAGASL